MLLARSVLLAVWIAILGCVGIDLAHRPARAAPVPSQPAGDLPAPFNLKARLVEGEARHVELSWDFPPGPDPKQFEIQRAFGGVVSFDDSYTVSGSARTAIDSNLQDYIVYRVRAVYEERKSKPSNEFRISTSKNYLLLFAIDKYPQEKLGSWEVLKNPVKDAQDLRAALSKYQTTATIKFLSNEDAKRAAILKAFEDAKRVVSANDTLLVYFAGHGKYRQESDQVFFIPYDGGSDKEGTNWLTKEEILSIFRDCKAKHILVVSDFCYGGTVASASQRCEGSKYASPKLETYESRFSLKSREILTSGSQETVEDRSVFARSMIGLFDTSTAPYLDVLDLYNAVCERVLSQSKQQVMLNDFPIFGHRPSGHFVFTNTKSEPLDPEWGGLKIAPAEAVVAVPQTTTTGQAGELSPDDKKALEALAKAWKIAYEKLDYKALRGLCPTCDTVNPGMKIITGFKIQWTGPKYEELKTNSETKDDEATLVYSLTLKPLGPLNVKDLKRGWTIDFRRHEGAWVMIKCRDS